LYFVSYCLYVRLT